MKLAYAVDLYISRRQSSSERFCGPAGTLRSFSRRFDGLFLHRITPSQVLQFLNCPHTERATWKIKYGVLRMFFEYWHLRGNLKTVPLPPSGPKVTRTFVPYIYSLSDLRALIDALPQCQRNRACAMSTNTFRTLLLFLYGTGMRIGEAVGLHISDVNMSSHLVTVRGTKFYKSRFVPFGRDVHKLLQQYLETSPRLSQAHQPFFQSQGKKRLRVNMVGINFRRLCQLAGVCRQDIALRQPRIHDIRHTFVVHRLTEWYEQEADVQCLILALSTYLGHVDLHSTQHYLTMTPELLAQANRRFENYARKGSYDR
jgi:site-specific recombinase XerD